MKSDTAIERHRRSERAEGVSGGGGGGGGGDSTKGVIPPLRKGDSGKIFEFNMSVEAILMHFETIFACKIRLIVQAFRVAVFKCVSNPQH